jgi:hypothetical protein
LTQSVASGEPTFTAPMFNGILPPFKWFNWSQLSTTTAQNSPATFARPGLNDFGDSTGGGPSEMQLSFRIRF